MPGAAPEIVCERCKKPLAPALVNHQTLICERCDGPTELWLFPASQPFDNTVPAHGALAVDDAARCFNHDEHQAERVCDGCGRFLCGLCAIEWGKYHVCTQCIEAQNLPDEAVISGRTVYRYDVVALYLMVGSIFLWFISFLIYPVALYFLYRAYTQPVSLIERWSLARMAATLFAFGYLVLVAIFVMAMLGIWYE